MKAALYIRVSTEEQAKEGYSIGAQQDRITKFIESQGWEIVDFYIDDGYSAKDLNRPATQRLIKDAKSGKFNVVVFYKLDRLVRSVSDLHELLQLFDMHEIAIRSTTEIFDTTTAIGRLFITIVAAMAQWERETIAERVIEGMAKKAAMGERNGGRAPFGYDLEDGKLVINEKEARMVKEMFRLYINGNGIRSIALYLQQFGIEKDIRTISRMLENPVYCGNLRWSKNSKRDDVVTENTHDPIVNEDTFEKVQELRSHRTMEGKKATSPFPFSGILRCGRCGSPMSGWFRKSKGTKHYLCISKKNKGTCDLPVFTEKALINVFFENLSPDNPEKFFNLIDNITFDDHQQDDNSDLVIELEKELTAIKTRKKNWLMALGNGTISQDDYLEMTVEDNKKESLIKAQVEQLGQKEENKIDHDSLISIIQDIPNLWMNTNDYEKKGFINDLFEEITVDVPTSYYRGRGKTPFVIIKGFKLR